MSKSLTSLLRKGVLTAVAITITAFGLTAPAFSTVSQGSATGVLFVPEMTSGTVWIGDIAASPAAKTAFWTEAGSSPDQVATTNTDIAWSSAYATTGSLVNKVLIAPIATTAQNIVTVTFPAAVLALASDQANNRIYAVSDGKIYSFKGDGTDLQVVVTDSRLTDLGWALAIDGANHFAYAALDSAGTIIKYALDSNNLNGDTGTDIYTGISFIDGLGVDVGTQTLYWTAYDGPAISKGTADGQTTSTLIETDGLAPSAMLLSNSTGKMYFTNENMVLEANLDGSGRRILYNGTYTSAGYEGLAIAFGVTLAPPAAAPSITTVSPNHGTVNGGTQVTITGTNFVAGATVLIGGVACTVTLIDPPTRIVCTTTAHIVGAVDVKVTNPDNQNNTKSNGYTYNPVGTPETTSHTLRKTVYFTSASAKLTAATVKSIRNLVNSVPAGATNVKVKVTGYVQPTAARNNDRSLSLARAKAVTAKMKQLGLSGTYTTRGNGRASTTGSTARKATIVVTYDTASVS